MKCLNIRVNIHYTILNENDKYQYIAYYQNDNKSNFSKFRKIYKNKFYDNKVKNFRMLFRKYMNNDIFIDWKN